MSYPWPPIDYPIPKPPTPAPGLHYRVRPTWRRGEWVWLVDQHDTIGWWPCRYFATEADASKWAAQREATKPRARLPLAAE